VTVEPDLQFFGNSEHMLATLPQAPGGQQNMSTIDIHAFHTLSHEEALNAADELSIDLAEKFGINYGWDEEVINFERPGVSGQILVQETELRIQADLGFMLMMLKSPIEQEIMRYLKQHFGCSFEAV
jgi:putative polyhydroxyalkanoate system protein